MEDASTELGVLSYLGRQPDLPESLLRLLGVFQDGRHTLLVTELADGGELFDVVARAGPLGEARQLQYGSQLLQAVAYLHEHRIGHRDISLENVLLKGGVAKLMDFGMAVQSHTASGTPLRYFRAAGKDFYRAPECYVPASPEVKVVAPAGAAPGEVAMLPSPGGYLSEVMMPQDVEPGRVCRAKVWGYAAHPADCFAVGVCLFILGWQCPAWHRATLADQGFAYAHRMGRRGLEGLLRRWQKKPGSPEVMQLLADLLWWQPAKRPSALACLARPCFSAVAGTAPPSRGASAGA